MLEVVNLSTYYGNIKAIENVSLLINQGEIVTLIGNNGAGKTTVLMTIMGILKPKQGSIIFLNENIQSMNTENIVKRGISLVPEGRRIFLRLSVIENLSLGAYIRKDDKKIKEDMDYIYNLFPILKERINQIAGSLSGGEQQMLTIGRALMSKPRLLLLDEPSLGLAPKLVETVFGVLQRLNKEHGTTIFLIEQNANMALNLADRGYVMQTGSILLEGTRFELQNNDMVKKAYLAE